MIGWNTECKTELQSTDESIASFDLLFTKLHMVEREIEIEWETEREKKKEMKNFHVFEMHNAQRLHKSNPVRQMKFMYNAN